MGSSTISDIIPPAMLAQTSSSYSPTRFTDGELNALRQEGDPYADDLAARIFNAPEMHAEPGSRLGYNKLVDIADLLDSDSELLLVDDSNFAAALGRFPKQFQDYYAPMPAPDWVDVTKLEMASELWKLNSLSMLGVLYAASLPACYLMKNGIPALYQTAKLKDSKYVFQRIYETGLMLDAVMSPGGIKLVYDVLPDADDLFLQSLNKTSEGGWEKQGDQFVKKEGGTASTEEAGLKPKDAIEAQAARQDATETNYRVAAGRNAYLWGRGYIAAKKVRMLHASMRYMLLNPGVMMPRGVPAGSAAEGFAKAHGGGKPWPSEELGVPVNQEDLAFTLLTFSYLIPRGLEKIGCELTLAEKESFLHLWRVVGHTMGLRDDLMTDNWEEAKALYERIHRLQAGSSMEGIALTEAVMGFLKTYLPNAFGISKRVPVALIAAQMGHADAKLLLSPENAAILDSPYTRLTMGVTKVTLFLFYRHYKRMLKWVPVTKRVFGDLFYQASEELVMSWRDEYTRKPFYVPVTLNTWQLQRGVDDAFRKKLHGWRQHLFLALGSALFATGLMFAALTLGLIAWILGWRDTTVYSFIAALASFVYAVFEIDVRIPSIFGKRPEPSGVSTRGK